MLVIYWLKLKTKMESCLLIMTSNFSWVIVSIVFRQPIAVRVKCARNPRDCNVILAAVYYDFITAFFKLLQAKAFYLCDRLQDEYFYFTVIERLGISCSFPN